MSSPTAESSRDYLEEVQQLIEELSADPDREQVASEIQVLQSIYGDEAIRIWHPSTPAGNGNARDPGAIRYEAHLTLPSPHEDIPIRILVSIPPTYPTSSPPQLQLLSRYIGAFGADSGLFGAILRTYISVTGVEWTADIVCIFDGLQNVIERCNAWYEDKLTAEKAGALVREDLHAASQRMNKDDDTTQVQQNTTTSQLVEMPAGLQMFVAETITDRKSSFIGRACQITDPCQVPVILDYLMSDRRIARAAHPIINAWRCQAGNLQHQDNDDDGETAAGGRLAHLLQILEVNNVLVVVTRYFGGIHLGPDRFKHINQAARNALELGGFLDSTSEGRKNAGRGKRH